jgi:uncharacterized MAPEG superfamily protein
MSTNYSLYAIPSYYIVTMFSHAYAIAIVKKANNNQWDNSCPRGSKLHSTLQTTVPAGILTKFERAKAAHANGFENMPLFFAAITLGNFAKLPIPTLNLFSGAYLASRVLYTVLYINTETKKLSYMRTGVFLTGMAMCLTVLIKAANAVAA